MLTIGSGAFIYWFYTSKAKEAAIAFCVKTCNEMNCLFLDDSVVCYRTRIRRAPTGQLSLLRSYRFEYTPAGYDRRQGEMELLGSRLLFMAIDDPSQIEPSLKHSLILSASFTKNSDIVTNASNKSDYLD
ncbi:MAG: DUF3301 domain-containing protein [Candidatus Endonucleobacter sp. (ex Gigantidas childressi)]|nr:DUF3301 domain-containing protein [Candidatus Endonucleobacter sp. (ex Gigantidas childressi)]